MQNIVLTASCRFSKEVRKVSKELSLAP